MEKKKITFGGALVEVFIFQFLLQAFVWFVTIRQLLSNYYSYIKTDPILNLQSLMDQSHIGVFTDTNSASNLMRFFALFTALFIYFRYFRKVNLKLSKKILYSILLLVFGFIIFCTLDLILYSHLIGNPFEFNFMG